MSTTARTPEEIVADWPEATPEQVHRIGGLLRIDEALSEMKLLEGVRT